MTLNFILLDAGGALIFIIPLLFVIHISTTLLIEGGVLYWFKYGKLKKCFFDAFVANLASLILGLLFHESMRNMADALTKDDYLYNVVLLALFYGLTVFVEGCVLVMLRKNIPGLKLVLAVLLMNLITYFGLFLIQQFV